MQYITTHIIAIQQVINSLGLGYHVNMGSGPWLNIKMSSYQCKKSHCGDKTILWLSYLHNGIFYTGKMTSLYWISPLFDAWCCQAASKLSLWWPHVALSLNELTHCGLGDFNEILDEYFSRQLQWLMAETPAVKFALRRMSLDLTDGNSTLVLMMAWCHQATSHYLSQCWPSFLSPYGVTRP